MTDRNAYLQKMEGRLKEWKADLDKLRAQAQQAEADASIALDKRVDALRDTFAAARTRLDELKAAGADTYEDVKASVEAAADEFTTTFERTRREARARRASAATTRER